MRFFRKCDYQRAICEDPTIIRNWFRLVSNTIAKYGIDVGDIYNFDETGFLMAEISAAWKPGMDYGGSGDQCGRLVVQPFIIGAGQHHLANWYQDSTLPDG
ncbi:hypothetical protein LRP88_15030 [Fusarium phalaenopsidis]